MDCGEHLAPLAGRPQLVFVPAFVREPGQDELLYHVAEHSLPGADKEILKERRGAAIRIRIVGVRDSCRGQIATYAGIVWLQPTVVSLADEWARERVEHPRLVRACALVEVARVLVQNRWQDSAADHNVGNAVSRGSAEALAITLRTLTVVGNVSCLVDARKHTYPDDGNRIGNRLECKLEL